jgi:hypothetical protein
VISVLAFVVLSASIAWVSVPFTDRGADCGTALGSAQHGFPVPVLNEPLSAADHAAAVKNGGFPISIGPGGNSHFVTYCQGQGRLRIAESLLAALVIPIVIVYRRRWRGRPTGVALAS